jgi:hypothetical protein
LTKINHRVDELMAAESAASKGSKIDQPADKAMAKGGA